MTSRDVVTGAADEHLPQLGEGRADPSTNAHALDTIALCYAPILVAMELYLLFKVVPSLVRPLIVTTAMRAAMRPYSIAVAPERAHSS
jgi:hypothetical protein